MEMSMKSFKIRYLNKSVRMCYTKNTFFLLHRCRPNVKVSVHLCQYVPIRVYIGEIPQQLFSFRRSRGLPKTVLPDFLGNTIFTGASRFLHSFQSVNPVPVSKFSVIHDFRHSPVTGPSRSTCGVISKTLSCSTILGVQRCYLIQRRLQLDFTLRAS